MKNPDSTFSTQPPSPSEVESIQFLRRNFLTTARRELFENGLLKPSLRKPGFFFSSILPELQFATLLAEEVRAGHPDALSLAEEAVHALEESRLCFTSEGRIGTVNDINSVSFGLVPFTETLLRLSGQVPSDSLTPLVEAAVTLFDHAALHINQTPDYLNPRGMDALAAFNLFLLTGAPRFQEKSDFWLRELLARQYPCGAQPYHTGGWIWGRKPAQGYQLLTATMMFVLGRRRPNPDALAYVNRLLEFERLACNRWGEPFLTVFEGLHKCHTPSVLAWLWPLATASNLPSLRSLARAAYERWRGVPVPHHNRVRPLSFYPLQALFNATLLDLPQPPSPSFPFQPPPGIHACPDISALFIHEANCDVALSLLTGYSGIAEGVAGSVKLYALTPELTDNPSHSNAGLDALRLDWRVPSEQEECRVENGRGILAGRGFTKWILTEGRGNPERHLHTRELAIRMEWADQTLDLEFKTVQNRLTTPIPSRLLFLLIAYPRSARPKLSIGPHLFEPPAAEEFTVWFQQAPVAPVTFEAPDGSALHIEPIRTHALRITAERPDHSHAETDGEKIIIRKHANEGALRLAFEGPDVLKEGRFHIRFRPPA